MWIEVASAGQHRLHCLMVLQAIGLKAQLPRKLVCQGTG